MECEDYRNAPTQGNANAFIRQVQEDFAEPMSRLENYLDYVSHRPGVQMDGEHGLWCARGKVRNLSQASGRWRSTPAFPKTSCTLRLGAVRAKKSRHGQTARDCFICEVLVVKNVV